MTDDPERKLLRGVLIRRLVIGVGGISVGIACLVLGVVIMVQGHRARMLRPAMVAAIVGVLAIIGGFVTLRVGEIREDLSVHEHAEPVPWKLIALAAAAVSFAVVLVVAWPLGIYRDPSRRSGARVAKS